MELVNVLPYNYLLFLTFLLGLIMGSFLDVVVSRFHTGKSLNGRSRCMSCGHALSWYELFPLVSYVVLRGRCYSCGGHIPFRLLAMEISTALLFVFVFVHAPSLLLLAFGFFLTSLLIVIAVYDMRHMVIPHIFVGAVFVSAALYIGYEAFVIQSAELLIVHIASACGASFFYFALWFISKGRWIGLGDAKLAFPLALMLTLYSTLSFVVLSFWVGAGISVMLLLIQKILHSGKHRLPFLPNGLTMKSEVPFAPFMLLAFLLVFFAQVDVFALMVDLI
jgi:prepilin signal peptidase PulO-like enzyme (type II secretory pathway)